ncbi:hypothetical protein J4444_03755 [Candidatus Woesearchaeota archaeon]|nr:hypothetical protein [Candidatus Woesearchaeota archaeon]
MKNKDLEATIKDKLAPLLEESMEKSWGVTIPKLGVDITDRLKNPHLNIYVPLHLPFTKARNEFKREFIKKELQHHLGNVSQLAKVLGVDRRSIHRKIKELDIDMDKIREHIEPQPAEELFVDQTIRKSLDQYKEIIQPEKMEKMYQEVPHLSRNIAKFLTPVQLTWKEAEKEFERQFLAQVLKDNESNIAKTARKIKIRPETLYRKIKKLGISV